MAFPSRGFAISTWLFFLFHVVISIEHLFWNTPQERIVKLEKEAAHCPEVLRVRYLTTQDGRIQTVKGNKLQVITMGIPPHKRQGIPDIRLTAGIHGNEVGGPIFLEWLIKVLCRSIKTQSYQDSAIRTIVNFLKVTRIHFLVMANPDGLDHFFKMQKRDMYDDATLYHAGRNNANNVDLNRNFHLSPFLQRADQIDGLRYPTENMFLPNPKSLRRAEVETLMIAKWMASEDFVISISYHGGQLLASVPFDAPGSRFREGHASPSSQDEVARAIAKLYMKQYGSAGCLRKNDPRLEGGIINGASWYSFNGSMGDYSYLMTNCLEITVEMQCEKYPTDKTWTQFFKQAIHHWHPFIKFLATAHWGIKGFVRADHSNKLLYKALIWSMRLDSNSDSGKFANKPTVASNEGSYFRLLVDGTYAIMASRHGYWSLVRCVKVANPRLGSGIIQEAQLVNFELPRKTSRRGTGPIISGCGPSYHMKIYNAFETWRSIQLGYSKRPPYFGQK